MDRASFHYDLPTELIAQAPLAERSASRLLVLDGRTGAIADRHFTDLVAWLAPGDLIVFNDTRVVPARLRGAKATGGRVELLLERPLGRRAGRFHVRASRTPGQGTEIVLVGGARARVEGRSEDLFDLSFDCDLMPYLEAHGAVPLPPYIEREPEAADAERYQTVFASEPGAVAAPTAGLHFDRELLAAIDARGVSRGHVTLHVGAGTFSPVRCDKIEEHRLHAERVEVSAGLCEQIRRARDSGGRIVAVGTTTVRALESAARDRLGPYSGETDLFIYPGFEFRIVDAIVTNFHLPESSLLMLVAAFAGREQVLGAYRHAVAERYRFFSYGDAMLLTSKAGV
ncbi:MAG TPA: tRNA preQ1(34) S-adenosylmethionine ribosyltransferase-isomerase QueA [Gammaproteobacteria bacterium]|nr:tRNA preQ1(34) S-adenosylmethionine ribosyltransferase-isomerase QueA [Gammaproteobacteria bacterium]